MEKGKKLNGIDRICWLLSRNMQTVLIILLVITGIFLYGAFQIQGEVILSELFPYDHPYLKLHTRFSEVFGSGASGIIVCAKTKQGDIFNHKFLSKLKKMTEEMELWDETYRNMTVSIASLSSKAITARARGEIAVEPLLFYNIPKDGSREMEQLKTRIFTSPSYNGTMVSLDGTAALLFTELRENISYVRMHTRLQKLVKDYSDEENSIHIVGFPCLMGWIHSLGPQMLKVFLISVIGMIVVLVFIFYGNLLGMVVVMLNGVILSIWGLGFIGFSGVNFSPLLYVVAFLVGARVIGNSHQITYRYFEELHSSGGNRVVAGYETMRTMFIPNIAAVATDSAGFSVLFIVKIVLLQHLAIIMTFWMLSIVLTSFIVPAICNLIPLKVASEKWAKESCQVGWIARLLMRITRFSIGTGSKYAVGTLIVILAIVCIWQMGKIKIGDSTPGSPLLWSNHTYNQDQDLINKKFSASSENLLLFYQGEAESVNDPVVLNTFENFDRHMERQLFDIYKGSASVNNMMKAVNTLWHDGDEAWNQLPRQKDVMAHCFGFVRTDVGREVLDRYADSNLQNAQVTLFFADHTSGNLLRIRDAAYDFFKVHPMKFERGEFKLAGGRVGLEIALNEEMKRYHALVDAMVLCAIFILCSLSYMSVTAGIMMTVPLILANSVAGAYMSLANIGLSINTLPVAAIGVGVGVDFAIYLYSRCIEEFPKQGGDWKNTITQAICTCGKAVIFTGITIIFPIITWYFFSDMKFQAEVGFFLAIIMGVNVLLTITLHPLMLYIIKPKFITRNGALKNANTV